VNVPFSPVRFHRFFVVFLALFIAAASTTRAGEEKQIANVVQRGNFAYVYDAKGSQFLTLSAGDGIVGFTQSTVSIRRGNFIYTYNAKGSQVSTIPAGN
jgi:hypothetical protein